MFHPRVGNWYYRYRLPLPLELITSGIVIEYNEVNSGLFALQQHNRNVVYTKACTLVRSLRSHQLKYLAPSDAWVSWKLNAVDWETRRTILITPAGNYSPRTIAPGIAFLAKSRASIIRANERRRDCTVWGLRKTGGNSSGSGGGEGGKIQWCETRVGK